MASYQNDMFEDVFVKKKFANSKHFEHKISGTRQNDDDHKWGVVACLQDVLHNVDAKTFKYHQLKKVL